MEVSVESLVFWIWIVSVSLLLWAQLNYFSTDFFQLLALPLLQRLLLWVFDSEVPPVEPWKLQTLLSLSMLSRSSRWILGS